MAQRLTPLYYTPSEGDMLAPWPLGPTWDTVLEAKRANRPKCGNHIWVEGLQVHAIIFADGRAWDATNGWREGNDWLKLYEQATHMIACPNCGWGIRYSPDNDSIHCEKCDFRGE